MRVRLLVGSLAGTLVVLGLAPARAGAVEVAQVFACTAQGAGATLSPGLGHTRTAQSVTLSLQLGNCTGASGVNLSGVSGSVEVGPLTTLANQPMGCPESLGGAAGNDYPDGTSLAFGAPPNGFTIAWSTGESSSGTARLKATAQSDRWSLVFRIKSGRFRSPSLRDTKIKALVRFTASDSFDCATDSDRIGKVALTDVTSWAALRPKFEALAVGDSITSAGTTGGYGPVFQRMIERRGMGHAGYRASPGTNPCGAPWSDWIRDYPQPHLDYVVFEDWYIQGSDIAPCPSIAAWRAAWQDTVNAAKAKGALVIMLAGTHPDLSEVTGIDIREYPVPPPDYGDGIHYTADGSAKYARNVANLLRWLEGS